MSLLGRVSGFFRSSSRAPSVVAASWAPSRSLAFGSTLARATVAFAVASALAGCGSYQRTYVASDMIASSVVLGAAIASLPSPGEEREPPVTVYNTVYVVPPDGASTTPRRGGGSMRDGVPVSKSLPAFDPGAARAALNGIDVSGCSAAGAPKGYGHAKVTMNPDGVVSKVVVDAPSGMATDAAKCIGDRIGTVTVPPFDGSYVTVGTTFLIR